MKKTTKYLMLVFLFLIIVSALGYVLFLIKNIDQVQAEHKAIDNSIFYVSTSTPKEIVDLSVMTRKERILLRVSTSTNVEVISRNASGTPTGYRIIK